MLCCCWEIAQVLRSAIDVDVAAFVRTEFVKFEFEELNHSRSKLNSDNNCAKSNSFADLHCTKQLAQNARIQEFRTTVDPRHKADVQTLSIDHPPPDSLTFR